MTDVLISEQVIGLPIGGSMDSQPAGRRIGEFFLAEREKRELTRHEVSKALDWKPGVLERIEKEKKGIPKPEHLVPLAEFYGYTDTEVLRLVGFPLKDIQGDSVDSTDQETPQIHTVDRRRRQPAESH